MATEDVEIKIDIQVDDKEAEKFFNDFDKDLKKVKSGAANTEKGLSVLAVGATVAAAAVASVGFALNFAVDAAIEIENLKTQFIAFTGSAAAAEKQLEALSAFSSSTPFQLNELAEANRTLLAFGSTTSDSLEQLRQLGEVASATGTNIGELTTVFGQIQAAGKLTGERFNQLVERGVNIGPTLAKSLGVAESSLEGLRSAGKITSDDVAEAFRIMTSEGGQFFGATERQSKTLSGSFSTLSDNTQILAAAIGSKLTPFITEATKILSDLLKSTTESVKGFDPLTQRIKDLTKEIDRNQSKIEILEKNLERIGPIGEDSANGVVAAYERYSSQLQTATDQTTRLEQEVLKLNKAQAAPIVAQRIEEGESKAAAKLQKEKDDLAAIEQAAADTTAKTIEDLEKKITETKSQEAALRRALESEEGQALTEEAVNALAAKETALADKRIELESQKLELQGQFDEAALLQAEQTEENLTAAKEKGEEDRLNIIRRSQKEEWDLDKQTADAKTKFDESTYAQRVRTAQKGLSALASLQSSGSREAFEIGKAAAIAQALVSVPVTAIEAYKSLAGIPVVGPGLGVAAAAAAVAAGAAQINQIRSQSFTGMADGGQVPEGFPNDSFPALLTSGEVVAPKRNFEQIQKQSGNNEESNKQIISLLDRLLESNINIVSSISKRVDPVKLSLEINGDVLAERILDLNQDNKRLA